MARELDALDETTAICVFLRLDRSREGATLLAAAVFLGSLVGLFAVAMNLPPSVLRTSPHDPLGRLATLMVFLCPPVVAASLALIPYRLIVNTSTRRLLAKLRCGRCGTPMLELLDSIKPVDCVHCGGVNSPEHFGPPTIAIVAAELLKRSGYQESNLNRLISAGPPSPAKKHVETALIAAGAAAVGGGAALWVFTGHETPMFWLFGLAMVILLAALFVGVSYWDSVQLALLIDRYREQLEALLDSPASED